MALTPVQEEVVEWLANGETGLSSMTMAFWLGFRQPYHRSYYPRDPDDLNRCLGLLEVVPLLRPLLPKMAEVSPQWATLIAHWDAIENQFLEEAGLNWVKAKSAPKTYALMRQILHPTNTTSNKESFPDSP